MLVRMFIVVGILATVSTAAGEDLAVLPEKVDGVAPKEMMHVYLMHRSDAALDRRDAEYEKIKTPEQVTAYQKRMRDFFEQQLGGFPQRSPLEAQVVAQEDRDGYRIEKIIFQSQPRHYVTAVLYLPEAEPPYPGVLVPCGHSANGKGYDGYQRACILLATNGMAALCYDPIDQGERYQLLDDNGKPVEGGTMAHCLAGVGAILLGRNTATYRVWDGMRGIDYLQSRPEIDPKRIGCTGNSGGGTLTSYLMALDDRIVAAAPSCYLTSFRRLMHTIGPQDAEQNIFGQIAFGMGHADYVMMRAPQPTLICAATNDFFDIGGTWDAFRQAKQLYTRMGRGEAVDLIETDEKHGFTIRLREGAVRWMRRWLLAADDPIEEPALDVLTDEQIRCTPKGQVMLIEGARNVYDLNREYAAELAAGREKFWRETDSAAALAEVRRVTGIRPLSDLPEMKHEVAGRIEREGYRIEKLILRPEPGIVLPALAFVPEKPSGQAELYLHENGKHVDAQPDGAIEALVRAGRLVLAVDLRGIGETRGSGNGKYAQYLGPEWQDTSLAYMLCTSYLAMRAEDVLQSARFLAGYLADEKPNEVHLTSIGRAGPAALHAVALEPELFDTALIFGCLESWSMVVKTPLARNQYANVVHGALAVYDLPDLVRSLGNEKLEFSGPRTALEMPAWK